MAHNHQRSVFCTTWYKWTNHTAGLTSKTTIWRNLLVALKYAAFTRLVHNHPQLRKFNLFVYWRHLFRKANRFTGRKVCGELWCTFHFRFSLDKGFFFNGLGLPSAIQQQKQFSSHFPRQQLRAKVDQSCTANPRVYPEWLMMAA